MDMLLREAHFRKGWSLLVSLVALPYPCSWISKDAQYLFKVIQAITNKGLRPYAVSVQNEPQNSDSTYPTMLLDVGQAASVGKSLRSLLDKNGFSDIRTIGYDHNWDDVDYPIQLVTLTFLHLCSVF